MRDALFFCLRGLTLLLMAGTPAHAQNDYVQQDFYLDAIQSIVDGRKQDASDALTRMIQQEPDHAGAWLDLAIIQCELGRAEEAERLFAAIESRFRPPPGIMEVIARQRARGCAGWQPASQMSFMLGRGIDSNVNQGASTPNFTLGAGISRIELQLLPEYLPQRDQYTILSTEYARDLTAGGTMGFVQFQARRNDALTRYDTVSIAAGAEHPWRIGDWSIRAAGTLAALSLGGRLYQQQGRLQARISPPLPLPESLQLSLLTGVTHVAYPTLPNFDANTWEMRGLLNYRTQQIRAQASAGYASDRASAARPGGDRQGWVASIQGRTRVANDVFGELGWSRQTWRGESAYSPGLIDQARNQTTDIWRGGLIIAMAARQALHIELREMKNKENIPIFQHHGRLLQVSWQWQNF